VQIESCPRCGGELKIIASIEEPQVQSIQFLALEKHGLHVNEVTSNGVINTAQGMIGTDDSRGN
jgi:hypothetical protein